MARDDDRDDRDDRDDSDDREFDDRPRRRRRRDDRDDDTLTREELKRKVKPPGIGLLVVGILSLAAIGYGVFDYFVNFDKQMAAEKAKIDNNPSVPAGQKQASKDIMDQVANVMKVGVPVMWVVEGILTLLILFGSTKLMSASSLGWGRTAAILAVIPCHGCWLVGIGVGIWALVTLSDSRVKAAFTEPARDRDDRESDDPRD